MSARILTTIGGVDLEVSCDFGSGFEDITEYVMRDGARIRRGRSADQGRTPPSTLVLTVDNSDGRFTPGNLDSPYWPGVKFRTPIRVRVRHPHTTGDWKTRFTGFVDEWPLSWDGTARVAWTRVSASGVLRRTGQGNREASPLRRRLEYTGAAYAWLMGDAEEATYAAEMKGGPVLYPVLDPVFGEDGPPGGEGGLSVADGGFLRITGLSVDTAAVGVWVKLTAGSTNESRPIMVFTDDPTYPFVEVVLDGSVTLRWLDIEGNLVDSDTEVGDYRDGEWHYVQLSFYDNAGTPSYTVAVDGAGVLADAHSAAWTVPTVTAFQFGARNDTVVNAAELVSGAAVWDDSVALPSGIYAAGVAYGSGGTTEDAGVRFSRLCTEEGVTATVDLLASSLGPSMGVQPAATFTALIEQCAASEDGMLYEPLGGGLGFQYRAERYNAPAYLDVAVIDQVTALEPVVDDQAFVNDSTVTRDGGTSARYLDADSVAESGSYIKDQTLSLANDADAGYRAGWNVEASTDATTLRFPKVWLLFESSADSDKLTDWLAGEPLGGRLTITGLPGQAPSSSVDLFIEGYTETWDQFGLTVEVDCSPGEPWVHIFTVESGGDLSRLHLDGQTVGTGINASATSLSVATAAGKPLLTTASGDRPFSLRNKATGEVFTVTNVTGASSPQTLTITRGQGGTTAAAMTAGDELELANDNRIAL